MIPGLSFQLPCSGRQGQKPQHDEPERARQPRQPHYSRSELCCGERLWRNGIAAGMRNTGEERLISPFETASRPRLPEGYCDQQLTSFRVGELQFVLIAGGERRQKTSKSRPGG